MMMRNFAMSLCLAITAVGCNSGTSASTDAGNGPDSSYAFRDLGRAEGDADTRVCRDFGEECGPTAFCCAPFYCHNNPLGGHPTCGGVTRDGGAEDAMSVDATIEDATVADASEDATLADASEDATLADASEDATVADAGSPYPPVCLTDGIEGWYTQDGTRLCAVQCSDPDGGVPDALWEHCDGYWYASNGIGCESDWIVNDADGPGPGPGPKC